MRRCIGFLWQGCGSGGDTGLAFCEKLPESPLCLTEPIPDSSHVDGLTYLRRRKSHVQLRERNSRDTKVSEEGWEGGHPGARAEIPLQTLEDPTPERLVAQMRL